MLAALAAAVLLPACTGSTDPGGGGEIEVVYRPAARTVPVQLDATVLLAVDVQGARDVSCVWTRNRAAAGGGPQLEYQAAAVGVDTVTVSVLADGRTFGHDWLVTVSQGQSVPPAVSQVAVWDGLEPGQVVVRWRQPEPTSHPITGYLVAVAYDAPVTAATWGEADLLAILPDDPDYRLIVATFGPADGLVPGARASFAVRVQDDHGLLSAVSASALHVISAPRTIHLSLHDEQGGPVAGALVEYGGVQPAVTGADGAVDIGPLRSSVAVGLTIDTNDYVPGPIHLEPASRDTTLSLILLRRYDLGHEPCGPDDAADFLGLFRRATLTDGSAGRPTLLWKWESYPLSVWIPPDRSPRLGWDLRTLAGTALEIWNDVLGEPYLVATTDSARADIEFSFRPIRGYRGYTTLVDPPGELGQAIPRRIRLDVERDLDAQASPQPIWVTEIALHELGHALGFYGHLCNGPAGNLMDWGGAIGALAAGPAAAIAPDEMRTVRAVRRLPQGFDTSAWWDR